MVKKKGRSDFKTSLDELTRLVETMEKGELSLEESLDYFERGITLTKECQKILQTAEQKVKLLSTQQGQDTLTDFNSDD